jgi:hypothetical protein
MISEEKTSSNLKLDGIDNDSFRTSSPLIPVEEFNLTRGEVRESEDLL